MSINSADSKFLLHLLLYYCNVSLFNRYFFTWFSDYCIIFLHFHISTVGSNNNGCSGIDNTSCNTIGGNKCCITCRKVKPLCKQQITNIVCGGNRHILAITKSGKVYSWGYNGNGELGHDTCSPSTNPAPTIIAKLNQYQVKQVACGSSHSIALTRDGKVRTICVIMCIHFIVYQLTYIKRVVGLQIQNATEK